jgi:hypothetical protein
MVIAARKPTTLLEQILQSDLAMQEVSMARLAYRIFLVSMITLFEPGALAQSGETRSITVKPEADCENISFFAPPGPIGLDFFASRSGNLGYPLKSGWILFPSTSVAMAAAYYKMSISDLLHFAYEQIETFCPTK